VGGGWAAWGVGFCCGVGGGGGECTARGSQLQRAPVIGFLFVASSEFLQFCRSRKSKAQKSTNGPGAWSRAFRFKAHFY